MATYSLRPEGLIDSAAELRGVTTSIEHAIGVLEGYVASFIAANAGGAATEYQNAQNTWNQGLDQMRAALGSGAVAIDNIRDTYHIADTQGSALFGGHI